MSTPVETQVIRTAEGIGYQAAGKSLKKHIASVFDSRSVPFMGAVGKIGANVFPKKPLVWDGLGYG
jgi:hypothetical protein